MPQLPISNSTLPAEPNLQLAVWEMSETEDELRALLQSAGGCGQGADALSCAARRRERLTIRLLLAMADGPAARIAYDAEGRPALRSAHARLVSISHSRQFAALLLAPSTTSLRGIGIDIEAWSDRAWRVREKFLSPWEQTLLMSMPLPPQQAAVVLWTCKEAAFKAFAPDGPTVVTEIEVKSCDQLATTENILQFHARYAGRSAALRTLIHEAFALTIAWERA